MQTIPKLAAAVVAGVVAAACSQPMPTAPQADCPDWNTPGFFQAADVLDVARCLQSGMDLEVRTSFGKTPLHRASRWSTAEGRSGTVGGWRGPEGAGRVRNNPVA